MELPLRDVLRAAEQALDAVEHVAVGADAALDGRGDLLRAPVEPLALRALAGRDEREVGDDPGEEDESGEGDRRGSPAAG